jgi:DNA-binding beta-propeller fold protein YncE
MESGNDAAHGSSMAPGAAAGAGATGPAALAPSLPPEVEVKLDFEQPQASERFVYAANPGSGTVSIIDAQTQAIQTLETGDRPSFLRTLAGSDDAIVLNTGSSDATIIRSPASSTTTSTVQVVAGANAIAVAPDGKHAVVYFDAAFSGSGAEPVLQDVSVITMSSKQDASVGMTVGFRPREVHFSGDGARAYVVTDDGISVLDFASIERDGTGIARLISLGADADQKSLDVSVTDDGRFAMARHPEQSSIRLVDLDSGELRRLELADALPAEALDPGGATAAADAGLEPQNIADISDLDLAPNGEFALAVARDQASVLRIPIPAGFSDPSQISVLRVPGEVIGSVTITPRSDAAMLYTTAAAIERITYLPLDGAAPRSVVLRKTVKAVTVAPDGKTALIVHDKADGDPNQRGIDPDQRIDRSYGYSVLRLASSDVKLQITRSEPLAFTIVPDGSAVFLLLRDDPSQLRELQKIETKSFLVEPIALGSPPVSLGTVPKRQRIFVNQEHAEGRITFIDWMSNETRTVTGFELNSRIRD